MKKIHVLCVVLLGISVVFASTPKNENDSIDWTKAEQNYKVSLKSDNEGVKASAATYVRKYKLTGAVEELKELLAEDNTEKVKMSAALALVNVGGEEGRKAVEGALEKEENEIVAEFYRSILNNSLSAK